VKYGTRSFYGFGNIECLATKKFFILFCTAAKHHIWKVFLSWFYDLVAVLCSHALTNQGFSDKKRESKKQSREISY
jgi:hypothetical protein